MNNLSPDDALLKVRRSQPKVMAKQAREQRERIKQTVEARDLKSELLAFLQDVQNSDASFNTRSRAAALFLKLKNSSC